MRVTQKILLDLLHYDHATGIFTWRAKRAPTISAGDVAGIINNDKYSAIRVNGRKYQAHRLAWLYVTGAWPKDQIDHIDGNKNNNRLSNLREATNTDNCRNRKRRIDNTSGFKGVSFEPASGKWRATSGLNGKCVSIGRFGSPQAANEAYQLFATTHHGEFKYQGAEQ